MFTKNHIGGISDGLPIIIKPNIGQPILINLGHKSNEYRKKNNKIEFDILLVANSSMSKTSIKKLLFNNIFLQPILQDQGDFQKRRGRRYKLSVQKIVQKDFIDFRKIYNASESICEIWDIYNNVIKKGFKNSKREQIFKCRLEMALSFDIFRILKQKSILLFDLILDYPATNKIRINYHSIALYEKNWENFQFIHASDSHIARRNDFIHKFLKVEELKKIKRELEEGTKKEHYIINRKFEFKEEFQEEKLERFRHGKYNFNNNLRFFISKVNEMEKKEEIDFIVITGDLVDYVDTANLDNYYENNFQFFLDVLLGINRDPSINDKELLNLRELMVPIFTLVGNHDYRKGFYSIKMGKIFQKFGLEKQDIKDYEDDKFFNYFRAAYSRTKFLKDYYRFINPNLNYKIEIGKDFSLVFLDTGPDSIANLFGLLRNAPATRGLKKYQIDLLRKFIHQSGDRHIILFMHTPPLSPNLGPWKKWRLRKKFELDRKIEWYDFYEPNIKKYTGIKRIDSILNFKYQTIMYRWSTLMKILSGSDEIVKRKVDLVFCGHTHTLKEFRIEQAKEEEKKKVNYGFYFLPYYIDVPCKIFTNRYRDIIELFDNKIYLESWFDAKKPFIFQTQGLGPLSSKFKVKSPGFRLISVKNNHISDIDVYSMHIKEKK